MEDRRDRRRTGERGFALVLAILSLMLLTFLGLTMATTTSTELQIATNYRWSQQALYNAEAGLEAARVVLSNVADQSTQWSTTLPALRPGSWPQGGQPATPAGAGRDYERAACDDKGGLGYGLVLVEGATRYENVSQFPVAAGGETLNGSFTIWVRRNLSVDNQGRYSDDPEDARLVIVSEGVAPFSAPGTQFTRSRQATRVLETRYSLGLAPTGDPCLGTLAGQEGGSPMGENFNPCAAITGGATGSLANAFGGQAAGNLGTNSGVR